MVSNYTVNGIYVKDIVKVVIVTISKVYGRYGENTSLVTKYLGHHGIYGNDVYGSYGYNIYAQW